MLRKLFVKLLNFSQSPIDIRAFEKENKMVKI